MILYFDRSIRDEVRSKKSAGHVPINEEPEDDCAKKSCCTSKMPKQSEP